MMRREIVFYAFCLLLYLAWLFVRWLGSLTGVE